MFKAGPQQAETSVLALRSLGWIAGLPLLVVLWAGSTYGLVPVIANSLLDQGSALTKDPSETAPNIAEPWFRLESVGRDLIARGDAPDAARRRQVIERLSAIPGLRRLIDKTDLIIDASPFVWRAATAENGRVAFSGHRPVEIGTNELASHLAAEQLLSGSVLDETHAARGGPPDFKSAAAFAVRTLDVLKRGAVATVTDTVISFEGEATSLESYDTFHRAVAAPPTGFTVGTTTIAPPVVADFRLAVSRQLDGRVRLEGFASSETERKAILAGAVEIAAGAPVEDRLQVARGVLDRVDKASLSAFMIRLGGLLQDGKVSFEIGAISIEGRAIDTQAVGEIERAMREGRPAAAGLGRFALTAASVAPYKLRLRRGEGSVLISGHVPDARSRDRIVAALRSRFVSDQIVDRSRLADGAPAGFLEAASATVTPLSILAEGDVDLTDTTVRLTGKSLYEESAARLPSAITANLPPGWSARVSVSAKGAHEAYDPATCARLFAERIARTPLQFAQGSSELKPDFYPVLDTLAELAGRCPGQRVEVAGYADPVGVPIRGSALPEYTASVKQAEPAKKTKDEKKSVAKAVKTEPKEVKPVEPAPDLAQQRASAVVDYLLKAGFPADRAIMLPTAAPDRHAVSIAVRS